MRVLAIVVMSFMFGASGSAAQSAKLTDAEIKEVSGRWIGTVTADIGSMPIALDLKVKDKELSGALETGHGNWLVTNVRRNDGAWVIAVKTPDGLSGTLAGRVKDGRLTGDWDFKPRVVGTFDLARPATEKK